MKSQHGLPLSSLMNRNHIPTRPSLLVNGFDVRARPLDPVLTLYMYSLGTRRDCVDEADSSMRKLHVAASASLAAASTAAPPIGAAAALLPRAVYVHLPFCRRRCFYCDFPIVAVGDRPGAADAAAERYCALLDRELAHSPDARPLASVYFGGGTPSLTPPRLLHKLLRQLDEKHGL